MLFLVDLAGSEMVKKTHATGQVRTVPVLFLLSRSSERRRVTVLGFHGDVVGFGPDNFGHPGIVVPAPYRVQMGAHSVAFQTQLEIACTHFLVYPLCIPSSMSCLKEHTRNLPVLLSV